MASADSSRSAKLSRFGSPVSRSVNACRRSHSWSIRCSLTSSISATWNFGRPSAPRSTDSATFAHTVSALFRTSSHSRRSSSTEDSIIRLQAAANATASLSANSSLGISSCPRIRASASFASTTVPCRSKIAMPTVVVAKTWANRASLSCRSRCASSTAFSSAFLTFSCSANNWSRVART